MDETKSKQTKTILVSNVPVDGHKKEIEQYFGEAGPIKKVFLVRDQGGGKFNGLAYITYALPEDATKAVKQFNNAQLGGKVLRVKYSKQRDKEQHDNSKNDDSEGSPSKNKAGIFEKKEKKVYKKPDKKFVQRTKEESEAAKAKSARLIIRNLSYQAKDADIRKHFSRFGEVKDVALLKRKDGKMVGCGFVQLDTKIAAINAIKECNMKPLLGRAIAVDWAIPKNQYTAAHQKIEDEGNTDVSTGETTEDQTKQSDNDSGVDGNSNEENSDDSEEDDDDEDDSEDESGDSDEERRPNNVKPTNKDPEESSRDVAEGRTLFVKNLPFDATEEDIAEVLSSYGDLKYVLLCIDKLTEHPRGTAFVQYKTREGADACLTAAEDSSKQGDFNLMGRTMYPMRAIGRGDVNKMKVDKEKDKKKDKRNLYLAREGMIREGTKAASGLSKHDLEIRTHRQRAKQKMLQNLSTFVSTTRLFVLNLPENMTDRRLGEIFIENAPDEAKITESKVMLNFNDLTTAGKAKSKGYGFVAFTDHNHALETLRKINNNPSIFTPEKRPIVEFSIENHSAIKARENRMKKSREKNPVWQEQQTKEKDSISNEKNKKEVKNDMVKNTASIENNEVKESKGSLKRKRKMLLKEQNEAKKLKKETNKADIVPAQVPDYIGSQAKPGEGTTRALPTHSGPKIRHVARNVPGKGKITRKQLRKQQEDQKKGKKRPWQEKNAGTKQQGPNQHQMKDGIFQNVKTKKTSKKPFSKQIKRDAESDKKFQSMVAQYKKKMNKTAPAIPEKRWFE